MRRNLMLAVMWGTLTGIAPSLQAGTAVDFIDPMSYPAITINSENLGREAFNAVAIHGQRLFAAGWRGVIAYSDNGGRSWSQATVPVQVDLTSINFDTKGTGWASGHDQVVLRSDDGGKTWVKVFDNEGAAKISASFYEERVADDELIAAADSQAKSNTGEGWSLPALDVSVDADGHGFSVGAFGSIYTTLDGGSTWSPAYEKIENGDFLNLNSIQSISNDLYIAGEGGNIYRYNRDREVFERHETGYSGSFFGMVDSPHALFAYGLRGNLYKSIDQGVNWSKVSTGSSSSFFAGTYIPAHEQVLLFSSDGSVFALSTRTGQVKSVNSPDAVRYIAARVIDDERLLLASNQGVYVLRYDGQQLSAQSVQ